MCQCAPLCYRPLTAAVEVISLWHHVTVPENPQSSEMHIPSRLITSVM